MCHTQRTHTHIYTRFSILSLSECERKRFTMGIIHFWCVIVLMQKQLCVTLQFDVFLVCVYRTQLLNEIEATIAGIRCCLCMLLSCWEAHRIE